MYLTRHLHQCGSDYICYISTYTIYDVVFHNEVGGQPWQHLDTWLSARANFRSCLNNYKLVWESFEEKLNSWLCSHSNWAYPAIKCEKIKKTVSVCKHFLSWPANKRKAKLWRESSKPVKAGKWSFKMLKQRVRACIYVSHRNSFSLLHNKYPWLKDFTPRCKLETVSAKSKQIFSCQDMSTMQISIPSVLVRPCCEPHCDLSRRFATSIYIWNLECKQQIHINYEVSGFSSLFPLEVNRVKLRVWARERKW